MKMQGLDKEAKIAVLKRIKEIRAQILKEMPFIGVLLMRLSIGLAPCETAFTDMKRIVFDPGFVNRLSDTELRFVMHHEVLHCVLGHCIRGKGYDPMLFNIACDIVVNSNIMNAMGINQEFRIDGQAVMHRTPRGQAGYVYTAEDVYFMLLKEADKSNGTLIDRHDVWTSVDPYSHLVDEWTKDVEETVAATLYSPLGMPYLVRQQALDRMYRAKLKWKNMLRDFVTASAREYDYNFAPPERRFLDSPYIFPAFNSIETQEVENLWFVVDASGSISSKSLAMVFEELKSAVKKVKGLKGKLSFFDTAVTEPKDFGSIRDLNRIHAVGGGGTSFACIFRYMEKHMRGKLPAAIIIMTDGYAPFPKQNAAKNIPVLWIIVDSGVKPPWGKYFYIQ